MLVVHIAYECAPIYKVGGLGDVVGALPKYQEKLGVKTCVFLPNYTFIKKLHTLPGSAVEVVYVDSPFFHKPLHKEKDRRIKAEAYGDFCQRALVTCKTKNIQPDIIHCHDWHTALIPALIAAIKDPFFQNTQTVLTIHNAEFQGNFAKELLNDKSLQFLQSLKENKKTVSFLKTGISYADAVTTVSPHYAWELTHTKWGFGLQKSLKSRDAFVGILNGIDTNIWNPETDKLVPHPYNSKNLTEKKENKHWLQKKLNLPIEDVPLYGMVARVSRQKGIDLVLETLPAFKKIPMQMVILGTGDELLVRKVSNWVSRLPDRLIFIDTFDEAMAHKIYAASDFFLIPSLFEPCGLTQLIAMRYGALPIATQVGGLVDTIKDDLTGFFIKKHTPKDFLVAIEKGVNIYNNPQMLRLMRMVAMREDFSWGESVKKYVDLYKKILSSS